MKDIIISIALGLFTSFCYDAIKAIIKERKAHKNNPSTPYSAKYIRAIKKEFYICFPLGILFLYFSNSPYDFIKIFNLIMSFLMFFFVFMAFMCSIDVINNFTDKNSNNDT